MKTVKIILGITIVCSLLGLVTGLMSIIGVPEDEANSSFLIGFFLPHLVMAAIAAIGGTIGLIKWCFNDN